MSIYTKGNIIVPGIIVVAILALLSGGYYAWQNGNLMMSPAPSASNMMNSQEVYKNGTYEATGNYTSPGGDEEIKVSITLSNGVITDASVTPMATRPNSVEFQGKFKDNFKPLVVGKKIDEVSLMKVSGSSLTPKGFNEALTEIKAEAKS